MLPIDNGDGPPSDESRIELKSEFAHVIVELDRDANGCRLRVTDCLSGRTRYVDPLEMECITRMRTESLDCHLPFEEGSFDGQAP